MSTLDFPLRADRWNLDWIEGQSLLMVRPKLLSGIAIHAGQYYDTALARVDGQTIVAVEGEGWSTTVPTVTPGAKFCRLSLMDYAAVCRTGQMPKTAALTDDPALALASAWTDAPTFDEPAIVVRVTTPMPARRGGLTSVITDVLVGRPYRIAPGQVNMLRADEQWVEGSRTSPTTWLMWKRVDPGVAIDTEPHEYRLGWCLTCNTPRYDCRGNERSGNRGHAGRPGQRGGSAPGELSSAGDALHSLLNGEKVNIAKEEVRDFVEKAREQPEDPDITDMHVEGMLIFGGNGLGIARADMPQIPPEHREPFLEEMEHNGIEVRTESVSPLDLAPTQKEISARIVGEKLKKYEEDPKRKFPPLLVAQDGHVLDGHHHWGAMATVAIDNPEVKVPIHRIITTPKKALAAMHAYDKKHGIERKPLATTTIAASETFDLYGTASSGNRGHAGRPGQRGGSAPSDGGDTTAALTTKGTGDTVTVPPVDLGTERPVPIKVHTVADAVAAILKGEVVEIQDVRHVHTVLNKLAEMAKEAKAKGEKAPNYDLCKVSVPGTNLFCGSPLRTKEFPNGVPRVNMPQFKGQAVPGSPADAMPKNQRGSVDATQGFIDHLKAVGIKTSEVMKHPASTLKATQKELVGATVARMMTDATYDPAKEPIFISSDNYVLDGHHRWAAVVGRDAEDGVLDQSKMNVIRVDAPMSELLHRANQFVADTGIAAKAGSLRSSYAARIFTLLERDAQFLLAEGEEVVNLYGTATSGNYGHGGRPGQVGGSAPSTGGDRTVGLEAEKPKDLTAAEKAALPHTDTLIVSKTAPPKDKPVTLVFGGSFNPPHEGHVKAIEDAVRLMEEQGYKVGKVVIAPVGDVLLKKKLADKAYPLKDRVEIAKRTCSDPRFEVSSGPGDEADNWPKDQKLKRTQLAAWAQKRNEGTTVVNVTGEDAVPGRENVEGFPSVFEGDKGTSHEGFHYLAVKREEKAEGVAGASSTKIRTAIREGTPVPHMTPEAEAYLRHMLKTNPQIELSFFDESWMHLGGEGSGNFGHAGRPGQVGGSASGGGEGDVTVPLAADGSDYHFVEPSEELVQHHADLIRNNPNASPYEKEHADIFGRAEAISALEMKDGDTESRFSMLAADGKTRIYAPERQAIHAEALLEATATAPKGLERPTAIFLGGLTAAGKSTFEQSLKDHVNKADFVTVNPDAMKDHLPEYNGENAAVVHEESSFMKNALTDLAIHNRQNVILDVTMSSEGDANDGGVKGQIQRLKDAGYNVQVMFMDVDIDTSVYRSMSRYKDAVEKGEAGERARYVPGDVIRKGRDAEYGTKPRRVYESVKKSGLLDGPNDGYIMIDNRGPSGPTSFPSRTKEGRGGGIVVERKGNLVIPETGLKPAEHGE